MRSLMKTQSIPVKSIAALTASWLLQTCSFASVVYDNMDAAGPSGRPFILSSEPYAYAELGDPVFLSGTDRWITDFSFDCFLSANSSGDEICELFFYRNDGKFGAPETLLYQSETFPLKSGFHRYALGSLEVNVPDTFTWAVKFSGIDPDENAGLLFHNPPTVGANFDDFWVKNNRGEWLTFIVDGGATPAYFAAQIIAAAEQSSNPGPVEVPIVSPPLDSQGSIFRGDWYNLDPLTRNFPKISISGADGALLINVFGSCSPIDCDWGTTDFNLIADSVESTNFDRGFAVYESGFATKYLTLKLEGEKLVVDVFTIFHDGSGRSSFHFQASFEKRPTLKITQSTSTVTIEWTGTTLQSSEDLKTWNDESGALSPLVVKSFGRKFYRVLRTQSVVTQTGVSIDLAISGDGFFTVKKPGLTFAENEWFVTRVGDFHLDNNNFLVTNGGFRVQGFSYVLAFGQAEYADSDVVGDIQIDKDGAAVTSLAGIANVSIDGDGKINITLQDGTQFVRGQILLQKFTNPDALLKGDNNLYSNLAFAGPLPFGTGITFLGARPNTHGVGGIEPRDLRNLLP